MSSKKVRYRPKSREHIKKQITRSNAAHLKLPLKPAHTQAKRTLTLYNPAGNAERPQLTIHSCSTPLILLIGISSSPLASELITEVNLMSCHIKKKQWLLYLGGRTPRRPLSLQDRQLTACQLTTAFHLIPQRHACNAAANNPTKSLQLIHKIHYRCVYYISTSGCNITSSQLTHMKGL